MEPVPDVHEPLEPLTLLTALAGATTRIGLGGTVSTSFSEPYNVARQFVSLDLISGGRAGWNVVTSANDYAARNFGHVSMPPHALRYERAGEFVDAVRELWDSWADDAFVRDKRTGVYFDPQRMHKVHHQGKFFKIDGALNVERSPQGHPVIIQAGASDTGRELAARTAEVVFASDSNPESAKRGYDDLKGRMPKYGRDHASLRVLAGMPVMIGRTRTEADEKHQRLQEMLHPDVGLFRLGSDLEMDLSRAAARRTDLGEPAAQECQSAQGVLRGHRQDHQGGKADIAPAVLALRARPQDDQGDGRRHRRRDGALVSDGCLRRLHDAVPHHARRPEGLRR